MGKWLYKWFMAFALLTLGVGMENHTELTVRADRQMLTTQTALEDEIAGRMQDRSESFTSYYRGNEAKLAGALPGLIEKAVDADDYTHYILDSYSYTLRSRAGSSSLEMKVKYRETPAQTSQVEEDVHRTLAAILKPGMSDDAKVKAIHDWIVLRLQYDKTLRNFTAYSALATGSAVCQGYSLLAYKMLRAAGFAVRIAEGKVPEGDHAWNLVRLHGAWYHLDVTWDDPVPDRAGRVEYGYYLKTDREMRLDHTWTKSYPAADTSYEKTLKNRIAKGGPDAESDQELLQTLQKADEER